MKYIIPILLITAYLSSCKGEPEVEETDKTIETVDSTYCNCAELTFDKDYNHFWRYERRKPFTGICETFYDNGQLKETKPMVKGKNHGQMISYYNNGQIKEIKEFDMNFQTGEQITYTKSGEVKYHALYKRGKMTEVLVTRPDLVIEEE